MIKAFQNDSERSGAWNIVLTLSVLTIFTQLTSFFSFQASPETHLEMDVLRIVQIGIALVIAALVPTLRKNAARKQAIFCFLILVIPFYFAFWVNHLYYRSITPFFSALTGPKLMYLVFVVLVPGPYWLNALLMFVLTIECIFLWFRLNAAETQAMSFPPEPWLTIIFAVVSFVLLFFRMRDEKIIRDLSRKQMHAEMLGVQAKIFLGIRDLFNSPLQTLTLAVELLKGRAGNTTEVEAMARAVQRLSRVNHVLSQFETRLKWNEDLMDEAQIMKLTEQLTKEV